MDDLKKYMEEHHIVDPVTYWEDTYYIGWADAGGLRGIDPEESNSPFAEAYRCGYEDRKESDR